MTESAKFVVREDDFVALDSLPAFFRGSVKQKALYFDRIAVPDFAQGLNVLRKAPAEDKERLEFFIADLEWLQSQGVVVDLDWSGLIAQLMSDVGKDNARQLLFVKNEELARLNEVVAIGATELAKLNKQLSLPNDPRELTAADFRTAVHKLKAGEASGPDLARIERLSEEMNQIALRALSKAMEREYGCDTVALSDGIPESTGSPPTSMIMGDVFEVVVSRMPEPDDNSSWERILEFRRDPDSRRTLRALRRWTRRIATQLHSPKEVGEELDYLVDEYEHHMKVHEIKYRRGTLEALVVGTAEALEDLAKIKWGALTKRLFTRNRKVDMLQAELNAPGREIAYVLKARKSFEPG
jgi:hypothetical protein